MTKRGCTHSVDTELQLSKLASAQLISRQQHRRAKEVRPTHLKNYQIHVERQSWAELTTCIDTHRGPGCRQRAAAKQIQFLLFFLFSLNSTN